MTEPKRPTSEEIPGQKLPYPASQEDMSPPPQTEFESYRAAGKLKGKTALITGGDSGIGRAVAIAFALEGANVAIFYNEHDDDASVTKQKVESRGGRCLAIKGDVRHSADCRDAVTRTVAEFGGMQILVNNAAYQMAQEKFEDLSEEQFRRTSKPTSSVTSTWQSTRSRTCTKGLHHQHRQHRRHDRPAHSDRLLFHQRRDSHLHQVPRARTW